jgi:hypothetical protein
MEALFGHLWEILKGVIQLFSLLLSTIFGVPLCEGPAVLIAAMMITAVTTAIFVWLNYDQFGLFAAGKRATRSTKALVNKMIRTVTIGAATSVVFGLTQCMVLMLQRALGMTWNVNRDAWMCPWNDWRTMIISRGMISVLGVVAYVAFLISMDGHFLGQDYLLEELMVQLDIDLTELDPGGEDADGNHENTMMRTDVWMAFIPTTFGLWFDDWNVKGFLMRERAYLYAEKFRDPQVCTYCGVVHLPYEELVKATAKTMSLCWQLMPLVGIIFAKLTEYANFPPLYYRGKAMPCLYTQDLYTYSSYPGFPPLPRTAPPQKRIQRIGAKILVYLVRYHLWWFRALLSIGIFTIALLFVFIVDPSNIATRGPILFVSALVCGQVKGLGDMSMWVWVNFLYTHKDRVEKEREAVEKAEAKIRARTKDQSESGMLLRAQVLMAGSIGATICIFNTYRGGQCRVCNEWEDGSCISEGALCAPSDDPPVPVFYPPEVLAHCAAYLSPDGDPCTTFVSGLITLISNTIFGSLMGLAFLALCMGVSVVTDRTVRDGSVVPAVVRLFIMIGITAWMMYLASDYSLKCVLSVGVMTFTINVLVDWTHIEGKTQHLPTAIPMWVPGLVGIPVTTGNAGLLGFIIRELLDTEALGYFLGLWCGIMIGLIVAVGLAIMLNNKPMVRGLGWGFFMFLISAPFHLIAAAGIFVLTFIAIAIKNEYVVLREIEKDWRTKPKTKYISYREKKAIMKKEAAELESEDTESTAEDQDESEDEESTESSNHSREKFEALLAKSTGGSLSTSLPTALPEVMSPGQTNQGELQKKSFKGGALSIDEVMDGNVFGVRNVPHVPSVISSHDDKHSAHKHHHQQALPPIAPVPEAPRRRAPPPNVPAPPVVRKQVATPPGTPPMTPRVAKFAEAENDPVDNPFKDGAITLGLQPPRRATLMATAKVSRAEAMGSPTMTSGRQVRKSTVSKGSLPGSVDNDDGDD